jgi:hypothetical protein
LLFLRIFLTCIGFEPSPSSFKAIVLPTKLLRQEIKTFKPEI